MYSCIPVYDNQGNEVDNEKCPYCRTPWHSTDEEMIERYKKRADVNDAIAIHDLGYYPKEGMSVYLAR